MKKLLSFIIVLSMLSFCVFSGSAATGITADEQKLIDALAKEITMKSGTVVQLPDGYINQVEDYLTKADLDKANVDAILAHVDAAADAVEASDAKSLSAAADAVKQEVIAEAKEAAKIINAELVVTKKNVTGESGTVVANYTAKLVFNSNSNVDGYEGGKEITITTPEDEIIQTGAEGNMTYVFVGAFVVLAAAAFVVASSFKKASSK